jgi:hypothetical protein
VNLVDRGFDLAIRIGLPQDSSLVARKLLRVRLVLVASDRCLAEQGLPAGPALSSTTSASSTRTSGSLAAGASGRSTPSRRFRSPGACASPTARLSCGGRGGPFDAGPAIATVRVLVDFLAARYRGTSGWSATGSDRLRPGSCLLPVLRNIIGPGMSAVTARLEQSGVAWQAREAVNKH